MSCPHDAISGILLSAPAAGGGDHGQLAWRPEQRPRNFFPASHEPPLSFGAIGLELDIFGGAPAGLPQNGGEQLSCVCQVEAASVIKTSSKKHKGLLIQFGFHFGKTKLVELGKFYKGRVIKIGGGDFLV